MTSLSRQLSRLRVPQTSVHREKRGSVSFLYDFLEAKSIDSDTHFAIATSGLQSLIQLDSTLDRFSETLFNESSKSLDRALQTSEANQELDSEIESFLFSVLSNYFLLNSTHKTIEWLIHRYAVNQYNVNALLVSALPYHETRLFARLVQTCSAPKDQTSQWFWLKSIQTNGCPLPKSTLITHCISEPSFLRLICDYLIKCLEIDPKNSTFLAFFVSTLINITERTTNESIISIIVSFVIKGLKSKNDSFRRGSLCICGHICTKIQLEPKITHKILKAIAKRYKPSMAEEVILTLSIIERFQHLEELPLKLVNCLTETDLTECHHKFEIQSLISLVFKCLLKNVNQMESCHKLMALLDKLSLTFASVNTCVQTISEEMETEVNEMQSELYSKVLSLLELRYPLLIDETLSKMSSLSSIVSLLGSFRYSCLKTSKIPLIFGLTHVNHSIQEEAIDYLETNFEVLNSKRDEITFNAIKSLLLDAFSAKSPQIVIRIFGLKEKMFKIFTEEEMKDICHKLLVLCLNKEINVTEEESESWHHLKNSILATYCSIAINDIDSLDSVVFPFLLPLNESDLITLSIVLYSKSAEQNQILIRFKDHFNQLMESNNRIDVTSIVTTICTQIANYYIENPNLIHKNIFTFSPQSVDYLKCLSLSLMITERIHFLTSDPSIKQKSANILLNLLEVVLKTQKLSKPKKRFELYEKFAENVIKNLRRNQMSSSNLLFMINSVINSIDLSKPFDSEANLWFWFKQFNSDNYFYKLFNVLFDCCYDTNEIKSIAFRDTFVSFVRKMFKHFGYDFFAPLWVNDRNVLLEIRSLIVSSHLAKPLVPFSSLTILSALIELHSPLDNTRESALNVINRLNRNSKNPILSHCLTYSESIKNDENASSIAISEWFSSDESLFKEWISLLEDDNCPQHLKSGIVVLLNKCKPQLLRELLLKMKNCSKIVSPNRSQRKTIECLLSIYSESNIFEGVTSETDVIFDFFINCLKSKAIQKTTIDLIDRQLFDAISAQNLKMILLTQLLDITVNNYDKSAHKKLRKLVKSGELVAKLLENLVPINDFNDYSEPQPKRMFSNNLEFSSESSNWKKFIVLLEIIDSKSHLTDISVLVKSLFDYLKNTFIMDSKSSLEYLRQLLLNSLINCTKQSGEDLPFAQIESVIECLRESEQKETQKSALILISSIAHRFKKEILDYVIPIFTFIGTNLLHCDDQYSIQIVFETMEAILPILLNDANDTKDVVINVFIDSLSDIPSHRRLILFHKLLEILGESQHLTLIFMKVIERIFNKSKSEKDPFLSLIVGLSSKCDLNIQIKSINELMDIFSDEFTDDQKVVSIAGKSFTDNDRRLIAICLSQLLLRLISSQEFIEKTRSSQWTDISEDLLSFLHKLIVLILKFNVIQKESSLKDSNNHRKRIRTLLYQILSEFNSLLPNEQSIELVLSLLGNESILIQRKAFELLNEKLIKLDNQLLDSKQSECLLQSLVSMVPTPVSINKMDEQHIYNSQLSMITCKLLSKHIGDDENLQNFIFQLLEKIISLLKGIKIEVSVNFKASCILCMTSLMTCLVNKAIPLIPSIVPIVLKNFSAKDEIIVISNLTAISKLTQNYSQFLSPYLHQILVELVSIRKNFPEIKTRLNSIWNSFAKIIPKRLLLSSIDSSFDEISKISPDCLCELMSLLRETFENTNSKTDVNDILKFVKNLMIKALDSRNMYKNKCDFKQLDELENCCNEAFAVFIPKLTEITFRPLFFKLYDCAIREKSGKLYHRMISFYKLMNSLAHRLKSLFCIFVGPTIVNNCSQVLSLFHSDNQSELVLNSEDSNLLIVSILSTLSNCFLYDTNSAFLTKDRMQALVKPIINQLSNTMGTEQHFNQRVDSLCLCTQYLIETNRDETIIKDINYQILLKTRDTSSQIRLAALKVLRRLILVSGEDYLPIIPETIPFISELSEDDSNSIEDLVKTVIIDLEQILGEPITKYL